MYIISVYRATGTVVQICLGDLWEEASSLASKETVIFPSLMVHSSSLIKSAACYIRDVLQKINIVWVIHVGSLLLAHVFIFIDALQGLLLNMLRNATPVAKHIFCLV